MIETSFEDVYHRCFNSETCNTFLVPFYCIMYGFCMKEMKFFLAKIKKKKNGDAINCKVNVTNLR